MVLETFEELNTHLSIDHNHIDLPSNHNDDDPSPVASEATTAVFKKDVSKISAPKVKKKAVKIPSLLEISNMDYRALQKLAKDLEIKSRKKADIIKAIKNIRKPPDK